jgi:DNA-binding CsgD family transcriptional regulator
VAKGHVAGIRQVFRVATVREVFGISAPELARAVDVTIPRDCSAMTDQQGLRAASGEWLAVASMPLWAGEVAPRRRHLLRLQRHWASAASLRSSAPEQAEPEAVFDTQGRLQHRAGLDLPEEAEQVARAFAKDLGHAEDEQTEQLWEKLWQGGYSVARVVDQDGKRLVVLRRTTGTLRLSAAEARVVRLALTGNALKNIAAELGTTSSTACTQLQSALHKLGLTDRVQLLRLFSARPAVAGK